MSGETEKILKRVFCGESCAFITSNKKMTVYGCEGVEKYTETEIALILTDMKISLKGEGLCLSTYVSGEISVTGEIKELNFEKKRGL